MKKPFVYRNAEETKKPGYLKARMVQYRKQIEEEKKKAEQHQADTAAKVRKLGRDSK